MAGRRVSGSSEVRSYCGPGPKVCLERRAGIERRKIVRSHTGLDMCVRQTIGGGTTMVVVFQDLEEKDAG